MKKLSKNPILTILITAFFVFGLVGLVIAATQVNLGTADDFAVLAGSGITNTGATTITGDVGTYPTATETGFVSVTLNGTNHFGDATTQGAKTALVTAYDNAEGQTPPTTTYPPIHDLGGETLTAGIYKDPSSFGITGTLTLNAEGNPDAVFIFQAGSTLITEVGSEVVLINGAQACNIFWQVGSSATLKTDSIFKGNILALTDISLQNGANVEGRLLARNGAVTLIGNTITKATCVVPPPVPTPPAPSAGSSGSFSLLPLIDVTKIPSPLNLPGGAGFVTYTYTATNIGPVPMSNVWVKDNKCSPVTFISGDSNNDLMLDKNESWAYSCTKIVSQTETNTATARGFYNGWDAYDTTPATVIVGLPVAPPLIHIVKKPSVFVLPSGGGVVVYSYTVTNPGTVPLSNVSVIDNKCTGLPGRVVGHPGDLNKNNLLESNESWSFTCQTNLTKTTTNIGTAEGHGNGLTAIDFSPATVVVLGGQVLGVSFPDTGLPPFNGSTPWHIIIPMGVFVALLSFYLALKKQAI